MFFFSDVYLHHRFRQSTIEVRETGCGRRLLQEEHKQTLLCKTRDDTYFEYQPLNERNMAGRNTGKNENGTTELQTDGKPENKEKRSPSVGDGDLLRSRWSSAWGTMIVLLLMFLAFGCIPDQIFAPSARGRPCGKCGRVSSVHPQPLGREFIADKQGLQAGDAHTPQAGQIQSLRSKPVGFWGTMEKNRKRNRDAQ